MIRNSTADQLGSFTQIDTEVRTLRSLTKAQSVYLVF